MTMHNDILRVFENDLLHAVGFFKTEVICVLLMCIQVHKLLQDKWNIVLQRFKIKTTHSGKVTFTVYLPITCQYFRYMNNYSIQD